MGVYGRVENLFDEHYQPESATARRDARSMRAFA